MVNTTSGYLMLSFKHGFYRPCNELDAILLQDGLVVQVSGRMKTSCIRPEDQYQTEQQSFVLLDQWKVSQDSLFNSGPVAIHLIHSEDYGYAPGYGYKITTPRFKILQPTIPGEGGNKVFTTPANAFKIAVLVAYKINSPAGDPSITLEDLYFFKIR